MIVIPCKSSSHMYVHYRVAHVQISHDPNLVAEKVPLPSTATLPGLHLLLDLRDQLREKLLNVLMSNPSARAALLIHLVTWHEGNSPSGHLTDRKDRENRKDRGACTGAELLKLVIADGINLLSNLSLQIACRIFRGRLHLLSIEITGSNGSWQGDLAESNAFVT